MAGPDFLSRLQEARPDAIARISKRGNREVRKRLYEATLSAARYNPNIQAIYRRLKDKGKPDKVARSAAARKLLLA